MRRVLSLLGGLVLTLSMSQAALVVNFASVGTVDGGPNGGTVYTYDIDIEPATTVRPGDYFVIYDFGPLLSFSPPNSFWVIGSKSFSGPNPPSQKPDDNASIANVQIVYTGAAITGPAFLDFSDLMFSIESPSGTLMNGSNNVSAQFFDNASGAPAGDTRDVPVPVSAPISPVPEPRTTGLIGATLLGGAILSRRWT